MTQLLKVAALVSGGGTNLQAIIDAAESHSIAAQLVCAGSDNPQAGGLIRAQRHNIPTFIVDYSAIIRQYDAPNTVAVLPDDCNLTEIMARERLTPPTMSPGQRERFFKTRLMAEAALLKQLGAFGADLLVLAGFMRVLTPYFIDRFNVGSQLPRIMNIHPALLPSFSGVDGYGDTWRYGCKVGGCTVHFVDYGEDTGPIIGQRSFPILPDDTLADIKARGLQQEWELYPECIQLYARNQLTLVPSSGSAASRMIVQITAAPAG